MQHRMQIQYYFTHKNIRIDSRQLDTHLRAVLHIQCYFFILRPIFQFTALVIDQELTVDYDTRFRDNRFKRNNHQLNSSKYWTLKRDVQFKISLKSVLQSSRLINVHMKAFIDVQVNLSGLQLY